MGQARKFRRSLTQVVERCGFSVEMPGEAPPTEFRIFKKGLNSSEKGPALFDDVAARLVMASYAKWGIDLPIDLEHQMIETAPGAADPTARDARGWCKLEVRNGELWAVDVRWTPDGAQRLANKTQRYISPLFDRDVKTKRVVKMFNIAITALPATHQTPALVAAAARNPMAKKVAFSMDSDTVMKALEALEAGDMEATKEILKALIASAAASQEPGADDGAEGDGAEGVAPPSEASEITPKVVAEDAQGYAGSEPGEDADEKDEADPAKKAERKAMRSMLRHMTGAKSFGAALTVAEAWRKSHLELETERTRLAAERATLESAERRQIVAELVKLGAEFPATVFVDALKPVALKERWSKMPIAEMRSHLADQRAARKGKMPTNVRPPPGAARAAGEVESVELSASELAICKETGCDPKDFAALKALRDGGDTAYLQAAREREANAVAQASKAGN